MKTATVADLRNNFAKISKWILDGEAVAITKRGRTFATLAPPRGKKSVPSVDRWTRLRSMFPDASTEGDSRDVVDYDRGDT